MALHSPPPPQDDLSFAGYQKHLSSCAAPAPLTSAERELQQIRINEVGWVAEAPASSPQGHIGPMAACAAWESHPALGR